MPKEPTQAPIRQENPHNSYRHIVGFFVVLAILLALGVIYLVLAKVDINLTVEDKEINYDFTLTVAQNPSDISTTNVVIPGEILSERNSDSGDFSVASGREEESIATGKVTLYNKQNEPQVLVATTRLLSPNETLFRLKDKVRIPAGGQLEADVYADQKGASGNIKPTKFTIPGLSTSLQELVWAESGESMTGGIKKIGILKESDIEIAQNKLAHNTTAKALTNLVNQKTDENMTLVGSDSNVTNYETKATLGEEVDSFSLSGDVTTTAVFADREAILTIARAKIQDNAGSYADFLEIDPASLQYELIDTDETTSSARLKVSLSGQARLTNPDELFDKEILVGFTEEDLQLYFSQFEPVQNIAVHFTPFWVKKVPILKNNISINISNTL